MAWPRIARGFRPHAAAQVDDKEAVVRLPDDELRRLNEQIRRHATALADHGVYLVPYSHSGDIRYYSLEQQKAKLALRETFGSAANLTYLGASLRALRPRPFGSWLAEGHSLHVFYALPRNGEKPGGSVAVEREDCVFVSLPIVDWLGAKTLIGGFTPAHTTVTLKIALGDRAVIDSSENRFAASLEDSRADSPAVAARPLAALPMRHGTGSRPTRRRRTVSRNMSRTQQH